MSATPPPEVVSVRPEPEPAVLAAIVVAVQEAWPRPRPAAGDEGRRRSPWRFSGRWWTEPAAVGRQRPLPGR